MLTTFLIPTINRASLKRAYDSAINQAPVEVEHDEKRIGQGEIRNILVKRANTPWVSFLDDDDSVTSDYVQRLAEEIDNHPKADVIYFRSYWADTGLMLPAWPGVKWGVGINFSLKRDVALKHPFKSEPNEDLHFIERLKESGKQIHFSKYITYRVRH